MSKRILSYLLVFIMVLTIAVGSNIITANAADVTFEAEGASFYHQIGRTDGDGHSANTAQDNAGYMLYGPYTTSIGTGTHSSTFMMMIDNNTADNYNVVKIDVYNATTSTVLAEQTITRQQFTSTFTYQYFTLSFNNPTAGQSLEFRVYWYDTAYIKVDKVTISAPLYQGLTSIDDRDASVSTSGTWSTYSYQDDFCGTETFSNSKGAYAQLTFTGNTIFVIGRKQANYGLMDIFIDGKFMETINTYSKTAEPQAIIYGNTKLSTGSHTIKIVVTGAKSSASTGTYIIIDKFEYGTLSGATIPTASSSNAVTVSLSSYFDNDDFSYDSDRTDGDVTGGLTFPAELVSSTVTHDGAYYSMGSFTDGNDNAVICDKQTISVTESKYSSIRILLTSTTGDTTDHQTGKFRIVYEDGSFSEGRVTIAKWTSTDGDALNNKPTVFTTTHLHSSSGDQSTFGRIYSAYLIPTPGKVVSSIILPDNNNLHVYAITMYKGVYVDLGGDFNEDVYSYDELKTDGDCGGGYTMSADLLKENYTYGEFSYQLGIPFGYGAFTNMRNNAVECKGQFVIVPRDKYSTINIAAFATYGDQSSQLFRIYYSDGTYTNCYVTVSDWCTTSFSGKTVLQSIYQRHSSSGDDFRETCILLYSISATTNKVVEYIELPDNSDVHVVSMTLDPASDTVETSVLSPNPRVASTTLSTMDIPVIIYDVTDFGATEDDDTDDDTVAFQNALAAAYRCGGGVVFAPAGEYKLLGHLSIPANVTLRGDWESPESESEISGTILKCYEGKDDEDCAPFISTSQASVVRDLSIWYPEQNSIANVHEYPWTIAARYDTIYGPTIENVTLVNSYKGMDMYFGSGSYIHNVYGTILNLGLFYDRIGDLTRPETMHFRPKYWADSELGTPPSESSIESYTQSNATGVIVLRNDWGYFYDIYLEGFETAMEFDYNVELNAGYNGQMIDLHIEDCKIGLQLDKINQTGLMLTDCIINTTGTGSVSINAPSTFTSAMVLQMNTCSIGAPDGVPVKLDGAGVISMAHCTFTDWSSSHKAIEATAGTVVVDGCTFQVDKPDIILGSSVSSASVVGNSFLNNTPNITNQSTGDIKIDTTTCSPTWIAQAPTNPQLGTYRKPATNNFYNVKSYGAVGDGTTNDTSAFQSALNAAATAGGGTVYVPAGYYKISTHLSVGDGVELRGCSDGPVHFGTTPRGTVLLAYENQGSPGGTEFISLSDDAGIRGFAIYYPNQYYNNVQSYPPTIKGNGSDNYVINVTFTNAYTAMKMTEGGYYINYTRGIGLNKYIDLSGVTTTGYIVNVQNTMGDWQDLMREENSPPLDWWMENPSFEGISIYLYNTSNVEIFNTFTFGVGYGTVIEGNSSHIHVYGMGHDAPLQGIKLAGSGTDINFVNTQITSPGEGFVPGTGNHRYIITYPAFTGNVKFFNSLNWACAIGSTFEGTGSVTLQQYHDTNGKIVQNYGTMKLDGGIFKASANQVTLASTITDAAVYTCVGYGGSFAVTNNKNDPDLWMNIRK